MVADAQYLDRVLRTDEAFSLTSTLAHPRGVVSFFYKSTRFVAEPEDGAVVVRNDCERWRIVRSSLDDAFLETFRLELDSHVHPSVIVDAQGTALVQPHPCLGLRHAVAPGYCDAVMGREERNGSPVLVCEQCRFTVDVPAHAWTLDELRAHFSDYNR